MTRAKTELLMTWRKEVPIFTKEGIRTVKKTRSRFLDVLVKKTGTDSEAVKGEKGERKNEKKATGTSHVFQKKSSALDAVTLSEGRRQYSTFQSAQSKSRQALNSSQRSRKSLYDFDARLPSRGPTNNELSANRKSLHKVTATLPSNDQSKSSQSVSATTSSATGSGRLSTTKPDRSLYDFDARLPVRNPPNNAPSAISKTLYNVTATLPYTDRFFGYQSAPSIKSSAVSPGQTSTMQQIEAGHASSDPAASSPLPSRLISTQKRTGTKSNISGRSPQRNNALNTFKATPSDYQVTSKPSPPNSKAFEKNTEPKPMDSTWFYPVGSVVRHKTFGRGVVVQPGQSAEQKLNVLVHFDNGEKKEFCATGNEISLSLS
jgi:hypothetical protein